MPPSYPKLDLQGKGRRGGRGRSSRGARRGGGGGAGHDRDRELYGPSIITSGGALRGAGGGVGFGDDRGGRGRDKRREHGDFLAEELRKQEQLVREQDGSRHLSKTCLFLAP